MKSQKLIKFFLSFFGVGFIKYAPGTMGSIATLPLMYLISTLSISFYTFIGLLVVVTVTSCLLTEYIQKRERLHDPGWIVIDEVIGMLVTWLMFYPLFNLPIALAVLISFRFFDIIKFWPSSYFDKKVTHGLGTIIDDIFAAGHATFVLYIIQKFISIS